MDNKIMSSSLKYIYTSLGYPPLFSCFTLSPVALRLQSMHNYMDVPFTISLCLKSHTLYRQLVYSSTVYTHTCIHIHIEMCLLRLSFFPFVYLFCSMHEFPLHSHTYIRGINHHCLPGFKNMATNTYALRAYVYTNYNKSDRCLFLSFLSWLCVRIDDDNRT